MWRIPQICLALNSYQIITCLYLQESLKKEIDRNDYRITKAQPQQY
jgi:hypothetical protein